MLLCAAGLMTFQAGAATAPIKLALFDFELEDFSAGASADAASSDAAHLANVTEAVRQLFVQSGRYRLIDIEGEEAPAVRTHTLRDCKWLRRRYRFASGGGATVGGCREPNQPDGIRREVSGSAIRGRARSLPLRTAG